MNKTELTKLFEKLGAREPEEWAASQIEDGINQLGRFLFLRQAWREIVDENDHAWIEAEIEQSKVDPQAPCAGIGPALQRMLSKGVDPQDITDVVRVMQHQLLFRLCYLLSDPSLEEPELASFSWGLFQLKDKDDGTVEIADSIDTLHESVLETDPTGREMRPRPTNG
jgi:hypothetical protein